MTKITDWDNKAFRIIKYLGIYWLSRLNQLLTGWLLQLDTSRLLQLHTYQL